MLAAMTHLIVLSAPARFSAEHLGAMASCLFTSTIHQKCVSYSKLIWSCQCGCNRVPGLKLERAACCASLSLRGLLAGIISCLVPCVSLFPLCASPSLQMSSYPPSSFILDFCFQSPAASRPSVFFFPSAFAARRPVFYNDISVSSLLWSWTIHRWLDEIHSFFSPLSPAVPHLPIKHRLSLSNWCLSCAVMNWNKVM